MSKLEDYLVTQAGISTATGGRVRNSAIGNFPTIGDILLSPNEKFSDLNGINKFDLLLCDGSTIGKDEYPQLVRKLPARINKVLAPLGGYHTYDALESESNPIGDSPLVSTVGAGVTFDGAGAYIPDSRFITYPTTVKPDSDWTIALDFATNGGNFPIFSFEENGTPDGRRVTAYYNVIQKTFTMYVYSDRQDINLDPSHAWHTMVVRNNSATQRLTWEVWKDTTRLLTSTISSASIIPTSSPEIRLGYAFNREGDVSIRRFSFLDQYATDEEVYEFSFSLPNMTPPDPLVPYRIVGDLT